MNEQNRRMKRPLLVILLPIFLLGLGALGIWSNGNAIWRGMTSKKWPTAEGFITKSKINEYWEYRKDSEGRKRKVRMYRAQIGYQYSVKKILYNGQGVSFGGDYASNKKSLIEKITKRYPQNSKVLVYYNREQPFVSVLEPGVRWLSIIFFVISLFPASLGLLLLIALLKPQKLVKDLPPALASEEGGEIRTLKEMQESYDSTSEPKLKVPEADLNLNRRIWATSQGATTQANSKERASDWISKGNALYTANEPQKAVEAYTRAIMLDTKSAVAYYNRGILFHKSGKSKHALKDFKTAAKLGHQKAVKLLKKHTLTKVD